VGAPIEVAKVADPTAQQVDEVHQQFVVALTELFDKHKHQYGWSNRKLVVI
jgi:2-acylglycerol O-acyltransferase 2